MSLNLTATKYTDGECEAVAASVSCCLKCEQNAGIRSYSERRQQEVATLPPSLLPTHLAVLSHVQHMAKKLVGWSLRRDQCSFHVFLRRSLFVMVRRRERPKKSKRASRNALQASNDEQAGRPGRPGYMRTAPSKVQERIDSITVQRRVKRQGIVSFDHPAI